MVQQGSTSVGGVHALRMALQQRMAQRCFQAAHPLPRRGNVMWLRCAPAVSCRLRPRRNKRRSVRSNPMAPMGSPRWDTQLSRRSAKLTARKAPIRCGRN